MQTPFQYRLFRTSIAAQVPISLCHSSSRFRLPIDSTNIKTLEATTDGEQPRGTNLYIKRRIAVDVSISRM